MIKICDVGEARAIARYMTQKPGAYSHMAPEAYEGQKYDEKADVWSFGVLLMEVLMRTGIDQ